MIAAGAEDPVLLAALPSEALRAKAWAMLDRSTSRGRQHPQGGGRPPQFPSGDVGCAIGGAAGGDG